MQNEDNILEFEGVSISQGGRIVLSHVDFSMQKGEFVYLIGRTGSGKSSLLKTIYADHKPDIGAIRLSTFRPSHIEYKEIPPLRRKIGIVFQDFQLFMDRSVMENLLFVLRATGWSDVGKMKKRMNEVLMKVGLSGHLRKMPHQLSGGEQQRVVVARALLNDPLLIVADEPTGNLDPEVSRGIMKLFRDINLGGTAVLMATHNHHFIKEFPGRVLKCKEGRVLDSNKETFDYADPF